MCNQNVAISKATRTTSAAAAVAARKKAVTNNTIPELNSESSITFETNNNNKTRKPRAKKLTVASIVSPSAVTTTANTSTPPMSPSEDFNPTDTNQFTVACVAERRPSTAVVGRLPHMPPPSPSPRSSTPSPLQSNNTNKVTQEMSMQTEKRKRSPSPVTTGQSKHYTKQRVMTQRAFPAQVEHVLAAASLPTAHSPRERERREHLAAFFLDWHLDRAFEFAVHELEQRFRK